MKFFYCKKCLMPSTRPRIEFNKEGVCNGCTWAEEKKTFDWSKRRKELEALCDKYRGNGKDWDMIVPWSGGKDSYHIAYNFKKLGMNPLLVKLAPMIPTQIGQANEDNIRDQGFELIKICPGDEFRQLNLIGLREQGRPWYAHETGITTIVIKVAMAFDIKWLCYGEEGETEYGGRTDYHGAGFNRDWTVGTYFSGHDTNKYKLNTTLWWMPSQKKLDNAEIFLTHWSYFSDWESEKHLETAKNMGFWYDPQSPEDGVTGYGTFTNYTSLDDPFMRTFNTYLMFLKFGFGRGSHEATGEIKAGRMSRDTGVEMAKQYNDYPCTDFWGKIANYYQISPMELQTICDLWANRAIVEYGVERRRWQLKPELHHGLTIDNAVEIDYDGKW
jgi:N-acetyl sugar amidotransferase